MEELRKLVEAAFAADGPLSRRGIIPTGLQRRYAMSVVQTLEAGHASDDHARLGLLAGATGIGKTIGYLIPGFGFAALTGDRLGISTFTNELQRQILTGHGDKLSDSQIALDVIEELTGKRLTLAPRYGARNFVSARRAEKLMASLNERLGSEGEDQGIQAAIAMINAILAWAEDSETLLFAELHEEFGAEFFAGHEHIEDAIRLTGEEVKQARRWTPKSEAPPNPAAEKYLAHVARAKHADVVVINHALLCIHARNDYDTLDDKVFGRPLRAVIVDEADRLPSAAESAYSASIPLRRLVRELLGIRDADDAPVADIDDAISSAKAVDDWMVALNDSRFEDVEWLGRTETHILLAKPGERKTAEETAAQAMALYEDIKPVKGFVARLANDESAPAREVAEDLLADILRLKDFVDLLTNVRALAHNVESTPALRWSPHRKYPSLELVPVFPGRSLGTLWWAGQGNPYLRSLVLTSASLGTPKTDNTLDFTWIRVELGLPKPDNRARNAAEGRTNQIEEVIAEPFEPERFGSMDVVLSAYNCPNPRLRTQTVENEDDLYAANPDWYPHVARMIVEAWRRKTGRVLALAVSYYDVQPIMDAVLTIDPEIAPHLYAQVRGQRLSKLRQQFRADERAVLVTPAAWEGFNEPGITRHVVISRIPFPPPNHAKAEVLRDWGRRNGRNAASVQRDLMAMSVGAAIRKFQQGLGRGVRGPSDQVTVWIADPGLPIPSRLTNPVTNPDFLLVKHAEKLKVFPQVAGAFPVRFRVPMDSAYAMASLMLPDGTILSA